jgi:hypothetical protein
MESQDVSHKKLKRTSEMKESTTNSKCQKITSFFTTSSTPATSSAQIDAPTHSQSESPQTIDPVEYQCQNTSVEESSHISSFVSATDISTIIKNPSKMSDSSKMEFLDKCWRPHPNFNFESVEFKIGQKTKNISFQHSWIKEYEWLTYSNHAEYRGGWCLPCVLSSQCLEMTSEKAAFVKTPFTNFNKSKELLRAHESKKYHLENVRRFLTIRAQMHKPELRIDSQMNLMSNENIKNNKQVLPIIVDAVMYCARQQISLRGHRDSKINYDDSTTIQNEGNFVALIRLLASQNPVLKEHLTSGPKNALYTSKTIQNQIILIAASIIRDYFRHCLSICPHYSIIADETSSNGREILSVCLRILDMSQETFAIQEVLLDMVDLSRITGESIAFAIRDTLKKENIQIEDCKGQAYDTTASMSSDKKGVQSYIKSWAPKADYQGCVLHSLNLVICHGCKIPAIGNMMDSCLQLFLFFDKSPKRQKFLEKKIDMLAPETKKRKLRNLCATRWTERHKTFDRIEELYVYIVQTLNEIANSIYDDENWNWDSESRSMANGLHFTFTNFEHIACFVIAKECLEPLSPVVTCLQGEQMEVYTGFQKVNQIISFYSHIRTSMDDYFTNLYEKIRILATSVESEEKFPRMTTRQIFRGNTHATTAMEYYKRNVVIPFVDTILNELNTRFNEEKRAHIEICSLLPQAMATKDTSSIKSTEKIIFEKWESLLPRPSSFSSELQRWHHLCSQLQLQEESASIVSLIQHHADATFFPNIRELLSILAVLPLGSCEAERSFSCVRRIHSWLRSTMSTERLSDLSVVAMHSNIPATTDEIVKRFISSHPRKMQGQSLFL